MTTDLDRIITQGYYNRDTTSPETVKAYRWHCRQNDLPCIFIFSSKPGSFTLLMSFRDPEYLKPTKPTTAKITKLRKQWEARLNLRPTALDLGAMEATKRRLTEAEAHELAAALWAIVGQPNAYEYAEPEDYEENEEDEEDES